MDGTNTYNRVIDIPVGSILISTTADLDELFETNRLKVYRAGYSTSRTNAPSGWVGGFMIALIDGGFGFQMCFSYSATGMWYRTYYGGTFNSWVAL